MFTAIKYSIKNTKRAKISVGLKSYFQSVMFKTELSKSSKAKLHGSVIFNVWTMVEVWNDARIKTI